MPWDFSSRLKKEGKKPAKTSVTPNINTKVFVYTQTVMVAIIRLPSPCVLAWRCCSSLFELLCLWMSPCAAACVSYLQSGGELMKSRWVLSKLSSSWKRLEKDPSYHLSSRDLTLLLLGVSSLARRTTSSPSSALHPLSPELKALLFSILHAKMPVLPPKELAACFWCMYTLGCTHRSAAPGVMQATLNSALERTHRSVREFTPKELLLVAVAMTRMEIKRQPLLLDIFRCMYTFLAVYDPEELAAVRTATRRDTSCRDAFLGCLVDLL